jgi:hypothetical protein
LSSLDSNGIDGPAGCRLPSNRVTNDSHQYIIEKKWKKDQDKIKGLNLYVTGCLVYSESFLKLKKLRRIVLSIIF